MVYLKNIEYIYTKFSFMNCYCNQVQYVIMPSVLMLNVVALWNLPARIFSLV